MCSNISPPGVCHITAHLMKLPGGPFSASPSLPSPYDVLPLMPPTPPAIPHLPLADTRPLDGPPPPPPPPPLPDTAPLSTPNDRVRELTTPEAPRSLDRPPAGPAAEATPPPPPSAAAVAIVPFCCCCFLGAGVRFRANAADAGRSPPPLLARVRCRSRASGSAGMLEAVRLCSGRQQPAEAAAYSAIASASNSPM